MQIEDYLKKTLSTLKIQTLELNALKQPKLSKKFTNTGWEIELIIGNYDLKKLLNSDDIKSLILKNIYKKKHKI